MRDEVKRDGAKRDLGQQCTGHQSESSYDLNPHNISKTTSCGLHMGAQHIHAQHASPTGEQLNSISTAAMKEPMAHL